MLDIMHESHEDPNTDAHRPVADEDKPPPLVNQSPSLVAGLNCATSNDVIPTNGDEPVAQFFVCFHLFVFSRMYRWLLICCLSKNGFFSPDLKNQDSSVENWIIYLQDICSSMGCPLENLT
jgi:hypothetical protein